MTDAHSLGKAGEDAAVNYLTRRGYKILARNKTVVGVEFDIIAFKDDTVCFVEVKTRASHQSGLPEEFVDQRKIKRLIRGAKVYYEKKRFAGCKARFDVMSVLWSNNRFDIDHIPHAFEEY